LIPEAQLREWEKLQVALAAKADLTDARLGFDPSNVIGDLVSPPSAAAATAASSSSLGPLGNPAAAIATSGLAASAAAATAATSPSPASSPAASASSNLPPLRFVGGLDISFVKDTAIAVASLVVLDISSLDLAKAAAPSDAAAAETKHPISKAKGSSPAAAAASASSSSSCKSGIDSAFPVVYEDMLHCTMDVPYVPGYLSMRELPALQQLLKRVRERSPQFVPQIIFLDGNGVMHHRKCGLAVHLGVVEDVPVVGVAKGILNVDGMSREWTERHVVAQSGAKLASGVVAADGTFAYRGVNLVPLRGTSGFMYCYGALTGNSKNKPVYISPGHRCSFRTAALLAIRLSVFRVIEPTRQADLRSRAYIAEHFADVSVSD
jgi:deoxyinosine 3'endonuclease (endonuclease V)